jgi:hypothetical protein
MPWIEKRCSNSGAASLTTLISRTSGSSSVAAFSKIGAIARQGPHQDAQKSTSSGMSLCFACLSKRAALSSAAGRPS